MLRGQLRRRSPKAPIADGFALRWEFFLRKEQKKYLYFCSFFENSSQRGQYQTISEADCDKLFIYQNKKMSYHKATTKAAGGYHE